MTNIPPGPAARIVVGVDGSAQSELALRWADYLARTMGGAQLQAVIVWHFPANFGWPADVPSDWNPEGDALQCLNDTVERVFGANPPIGLELLVREGNPAHVLLEQSRDVALLVLGSRGHGGFPGLLLGSVSMACAEHAHCPVLVVHGDEAPPTGP